MTYDFRGYFRFLLRWLSLPGWSWRRLGTVLAFLFLYPLLELVIWLGLGLDRLLLPAHRRVAVRQPLFVIGNFRSGTTFLHRVLARDQARFSSMAMWEILFAPAIVLRRLVAGMARAERWIGRPVGRLVDLVHRQWGERVVVHEVRLDEPEEDDYLGLHCWSVFVAGMSSGVLAEARPYLHFDQRIPPARQRQIMGFYRRCLQRHLYARPEAIYLAKNPALTPKLRAVLTEFPDARFIQLLRDPLQTVPSFVSMMRWAWGTIGAPVARQEAVDFALEMALHWYLYPQTALAGLPADRFVQVNYHALRQDPAGTLEALYDLMDLGPLDRDWLAEEAGRAEAFHSGHHYDLGELGMSEEAFRAHFAEVYRRYDFSPGAWACRPGNEAC